MSIKNKITIEIEKVSNIKDERKVKLTNIISKEKFTTIPENFNWKISGQKTNDENLKDLQKFCLSVAKDILLNRFFTNEKGKINYDVDKSDNKLIVENIDKILIKIDQI